MTVDDEAAAREREILIRALGALGGAGGARGAGRAGRSGGKRGATFAAKRLREDRCELSVELGMGPDDALSLAALVRAVAKEGLIKQRGGHKAAARIRDALLGAAR